MLSLYRLPQPMEGEKVIRVLHRDIFIAMKRVALFVTLLILPLLVFLVVNQTIVVNENYNWVLVLVYMITSVYLLFIWLLFFFSIIDYILDVWIITDRRIIDVRQNGFFSRTISEQTLSKIQDISSETHGFWATMWKYGNLSVQTAGEKNKLFFEEIPDPEAVRDMLIKLVAASPVNSSSHLSTTVVPEKTNETMLHSSHDHTHEGI